MKLTAAVLFLFLALSPQPAYAELCGDNNGNITINGTPQPSLHNCPADIQIGTNGDGHTEITVHNNSHPAPTQPPIIITVVVTATPTQTPTPILYHPYKPVHVMRFTPTPTQEPTATPSATRTPAPTKIQKPKISTHAPPLFQHIAHFFQNIFHFFQKL